MHYPEKCPRGRTDCQPTGQVLADDESTFVCVGERQGDPETWSVPQDRFTFCQKSEEGGVDILVWCDRYDLDSQVYAISRALLMDDLREGASD